MWNVRSVFAQHFPLRFNVRQLSSGQLINRIFIDGQWRSTNCTFPVHSPADGRLIGEAPETSPDQLVEAIESSSSAFQNWSTRSGRERSAFIRRLFDLQCKHSEHLAWIISKEMGKPLSEARTEIVYGGSFFEWFAEQAKRVNGELLTSPWAGHQVSIHREPIGPVAIVTPWNFPNAMITRKLGAVLAAGCTAIVRPSPNSPYSALALAQLAEEAQLPPGVLNVITGSRTAAPPIARTLCEHPKVAGLSFTGSTSVGKILLGLCSTGVKRTCLELGGNAPFVVFESADLDRAVAGLIVAKFRNGGQTCVCANRVLVHESVHDEFVRKLADAMRTQLKLGDPMDEQTTVGPLVSADALLKVKEHVQDALANGARLIMGGRLPKNLTSGHFYEPTLLVDVSAKSRLCHEETFGPVAAVIRFQDEAEAVRLANDCEVGLAGYVYSEDRRQVHRVVRALQVGMIGVNEAMISAAEVPFGGVKQSGIGREGSHYGVEEFTNVKYVCEHIA